MSYAVVRGKPLATQLYLDGVLDEILEAKGIQPDAQERSKVNLPQILYHSLRKNPSDIFMINGTTGERITNEQLLKLSVPLARWLISKGLKGKNVMVVMRSHPRMIALYFALIFAGVVPLLVDSILSTEFEFIHFLKLIEPVSVFCDEERREKLLQSLRSCPGVLTDVIVADQDETLEQLYAEHSDSLYDFQVSDTSVDSTAMYLPSSGSTGLPKAIFISQRGLVVQLPIIWLHHSQFPKPTELVMLMTSIQWMTFTMMMTSCVVYHVPFLTSPIEPSVEYDIELLEKFRPTWTFFGPAFVRCLVTSASPDQLASLETLVLVGEPTTPELISTLREKLPKSTQIYDGYGATETQGSIAMQDVEVPFKSNGRVINIFNYKLVDDNGQEVGLCQKGELYLKGASIIKGYYKDEKSYNEAFSDGWFKTGDIFYIDDKERLYYHIKKKFSFKYHSTDVAPEKVEHVINAIPGIQESVVCGTEDGAAAAVILRPNTIVSRNQIHEAVNAMLSDHMRLHGGIAFVQSLPRTHTGKLKRLECTKLILELIYNGQCILNV